jgi:UDP-N-acetyl-2-amino-2-deoxyglucuronate dehydrogenase
MPSKPKSRTLPKMRVALIGVGAASRPHAQNLVDLGDRVEVAVAVAKSTTRLAEFGRSFPFRTSTRIEDVLEDPGITAALVLTPPDTHVELVTRLAQAGKHVLLEKPLALDLARAMEVVSACERAGVTLAVVLQHRFRQAAEALTRLVVNGELGALAGASVAVRWWRPQTYYDEPGRGTRARDGGGVLMTQAIHTLDLFLSLAGEPEEVSAFAATTALHRMECEDIVCGALRFANGALGAIDATTACYPGCPERIELIGTRGTAILTGGQLEVAYHDGRTEHCGGDDAGGSGANIMAFSPGPHRALLVDFLDAVEQRRPPRIPGRDALRVHRVIDALLRSAASRQIVTL